MNKAIQLVVFRLEGQRFALPLIQVERVVAAVQVTALPGAPAVVRGAINVAGHLVPVFCIRRRFLLQEREIGPADQFVIARAGQRTVALIIDEAEGVIECDTSKIDTTDALTPGLEKFEGIAKVAGELMLIFDLKRFLNLDEVRTLDSAMELAG